MQYPHCSIQPLNPYLSSSGQNMSVPGQFGSQELFNKVLCENRRLKSVVCFVLQRLAFSCRLQIPPFIAQNPDNFKGDNQRIPLKIEENLVSSSSQMMLDDSFCFNSKIEPESTEIYHGRSEENLPFDKDMIKKEDLYLKNTTNEEKYYKRKILQRVIQNRGAKKNKADKRPDTKHLWITYGRVIKAYALKHSDAIMQDKMKNLNINLDSKQAFSRVFMIKPHDNEEEVNFKKTFGELALKYLDEETENAFLSSKHRQDFLRQKDKVASWISSLITLSDS